MSEIGALGSYVSSIQQMQINLIKQNAEMQQELIEMLAEMTKMVPVSKSIGQHIDISI